jgi:Holliday junction resolvase-like predicted endonuclease
MEEMKNIEPATPESVWAILRETAAQQKEIQAEHEQRQKEFQARHEQRMAEYAAQREKDRAEYKQQQAEYAVQREKDRAEYKQERKEFRAEYEQRQEKFQEAYEQRQKKFQAAYEQRQKKFQAKYAQQQAEYEQRQKKYDAQRAKAAAVAEKSLEELKEMLGGSLKNNGFFAEEYFYNALNASRSFGNIKYDVVDKNMGTNKGKVRDEFDVVMLNGSSVAIIEVKYRVHQSLLEKLTTQKVQNFRAIFPKYAKHKIYLGIASMSFNDVVVAQAKQLGIGLLRPKGGIVECDTEHIKAY